MAQMDSKQAAAYLIDPLNAPEPSAETGPGTHFGSTFQSKPATAQSRPAQSTNPPHDPLPPTNPFRDQTASTEASSSKTGTYTSTRPVGSIAPPKRYSGHRQEAFGEHATDPRRTTDAPPSYGTAASPRNSPNNKSDNRHRRTSSLKERFPGDESNKPLDVIRRDSKKAHRSPHLAKRHMPGADSIDKLDPALGGRAYHHEGPYDAAMLARNTSYENSPIAALKTSNAEALKATPQENIKDAVERHKPLDGVAIVPPGESDRFGRTYDYEEGTDMMRETLNTEPGYKRWADKDYDPEDLKGEAEPAFSLDRALKAHKIDDNGIEMEDHAHLMRDYHNAERKGRLDPRDPVEIAGDDAKYAALQYANDRDVQSSVKRTGSLRAAGEGLKKRIGSLRKKHHNDD